MTQRSLRFRVLLSLVLAGVVLALGLGGYLFVKSRRGRGALLRAEEAFSEGQWRDAKTNYTWYLVRHPGDPEVLPKYIESCLQLLSDRRANVSDAGRAHLQLALETRSDRDQAQQAIDFYRRHRLWRELDYAADLFLRQFPDDERLKFSKALANEGLGRAALAIAEYEGLVESGSAEPEVYGNLALLHHQQGLEAKGRAVLEDASAKWPNDPRVRAERARFLMAAGDLTQAAEEMEAALAAGVETGEVLLTAARIYMARQEWETAQSFAEKALGELPDSAEGCGLVANCLLGRRQVDEAVAFLSGIDPYVMADNPQLYLILAETQIDAGLLDDVEQTLEAFRTAYPRERNIVDYLSAQKLLKEGDASEAAARLEIVVERAPELGAARFALVRAYIESGQRGRAKDVLEMYIQSNPADKRARRLWDAAFAERSSQEVEAAARALLDSHDTPHFGSLYSMAHSLARMNSDGRKDGESLELAKSLLERAIQEHPSAPEGYRDLVFLLLDQGDLEGARHVLVRATDAGVPPLELNLVQGALAIAEGKPDQARSHFDQEMAEGDVAPQRTMQWAELFASRGHLDAGLALLEDAKAHEDGEGNRQELDLAQVTLCLRSGSLERAQTLIARFAEAYSEAPAAVGRLNDSRMSVARALLESGGESEEAAAEALIAEVLRSQPNRTDVKVLRARLLVMQDPPDLDAAEDLCAAARDGGASDAETFLVSGEIAYRKNQFANALDFAEKANAKSPGDFRTSMALARARLQMGLLSDAILVLEKLRPAFPEDQAILDLLARAYAGAGRFSEAEALAKQLESMEGGQTAVSLRAWILVSQGNWAAAGDLLRAMHETDPENLWTIHFLAKAMAEQGQWQSLEDFLNLCVSRRPGHPELWVELGNSYLTDPGAERLSKASFAFTQALVLEPDYPPALRGLLEVHLRSGERGAALGLCERYLAQNPNDPAVLERKATLLAQIPGRREDALNAIQQAIEAAPRPELFYVRARLRLEAGEFANAIEDLRRADQAGGVTQSDMNILMAEAYLGLNDLELARKFHALAESKRQALADSDRQQLEPADQARLDSLAARLAENFYERGRLRLENGEYQNAIDDLELAGGLGADVQSNLNILKAEAYLGLNNLEQAREFYRRANDTRPQLKPADQARLDSLAARLAEKEG